MCVLIINEIVIIYGTCYYMILTGYKYHKMYTSMYNLIQIIYVYNQFINTFYQSKCFMIKLSFLLKDYLKDLRKRFLSHKKR